MSADRRRLGLRHRATHGGLAVLLSTLFFGCGDETPECGQPVLTNEQEAALVRTTIAAAEGMAATAQDTPVADVVATASDFQSEHENHLVDPDPCEDFGDVLMVYQLVVADLIANSSTISPELAAGLARAAREDGAGGLYTLVTESEVFLRDEYPGLGEMRDRLIQQRDRADEVFEALGPAESSSSED